MAFANTTPSDVRLRTAVRQVFAAAGCGPLRPRAWTVRLSDRHVGDAHRDDGDLTSLAVPPAIEASAASAIRPAGTVRTDAGEARSSRVYLSGAIGGTGEVWSRGDQKRYDPLK